MTDDWSIRGGLITSLGRWDPALRVSRHTALISAAEVAEGPQLSRVLCTLPLYYTILYYTPHQCPESRNGDATRPISLRIVDPSSLPPASIR